MHTKISLLLSFLIVLAADGTGKGLRSLEREARAALTALPSQCSSSANGLLETAQTTALATSSNCSVNALTKVVEDIYIYSGEYVAAATSVVTKIGLHFTGCAMELIPLRVIMCVYHSVLELPGEISTLVIDSMKYFGNILSLVPVLVSDIESCFTNSTSEYQTTLRSLVQEAKPGRGSICECSPPPVMLDFWSYH